MVGAERSGPAAVGRGGAGRGVVEPARGAWRPRWARARRQSEEEAWA